MGEKGNLVDLSEEVFANLAEQGPQFWVAYEQYKESRNRVTQPQAARVTQPQATQGQGKGAPDPATRWPGSPAPG
jgi:hypothetical protein